MIKRIVLFVSVLIILTVPAFGQGAPPPTSLGISGWEMNRGGGDIYLNGITLAYHGDPSVYAWASIPPADDTDWGPAPNTETIGFSETSDLPGVLTYADFTYFQTFLSIPENTVINACYVDFNNADDGAQITIFNSANPNGFSPPNANIRLGGPAVTSDISQWIAIGEVNRVVITQVDNQATGNNLGYAAIVLNGTPILLNQAPTANAGGDQSEGCATGEVSFTLDGSGSSDPDGDVLSYSWTHAGVEVATSASFETASLGNLLANGSFEDGMTGWVNNGVTTPGNGQPIDRGQWSQATDGTWVLDLVGSMDWSWSPTIPAGFVEQTVGTEIGKKYNLSFDFYGNNASLVVTIDGNSSTYSHYGSMSSQTVSFTANASQTTIRLAADDGYAYNEASVYLDNVSVTLGGGSHTFVLTVSDGELTDSDEVAVSVSLDNEVPTIAVIDDISTGNDEGVCGAVVNFDVDASDDCELASVVADPASGSVFPIGTTEVTVTATDAVGNSTSTTFNVTVNDTEAPAITAPEAVASFNDAGECGAIVTFDVSASDNCDVTEFASSHASGAFFPVGITEVTVTASDAAGNDSESTFTVTVEDNEAPAFVVSADAATMWPPNHKYRSFDVSDFVVSLDDNCADLDLADIVITSVTSDEVEDARGGGDGKTRNDMVIGDGSVELRAERQGGGNGRVYTVHLALADGNGNSSSSSFQVHVPHSRNSAAIDDGVAYTVDGSALTKFTRGNEEAIVVIPDALALNQNYPNPFNPSTMISYGLPESGQVRLVVYDMRGSVVTQLVNTYQSAGMHSVHFNAADFAAGTYLYVLEANGERYVERMLLLK